MGTATPKYQILLDWVMENAENGKMKPGCKIPSENELAEMFGISRQTVRHAIGLLEQKDVVKRVRGIRRAGGRKPVYRTGRDRRCGTAGAGGKAKWQQVCGRAAQTISERGGDQHLCGRLYFPLCDSGH